jgi:site-specific DNA-methyltransferase (adenine-specific)
MMIKDNEIYNEDCLEFMKKINNNHIDFIITSPPYNLNDNRYYNEEFKDNLNEDEYVSWLNNIIKEFMRILKDEGSVFFNISYNNNSRSSYIKVINCFLNNGFILQETICWLRKGMPLTEIGNLTRDFEPIFLFSKKNNYFTNQNENQIISNVWDIKNRNHNFGDNKACFPVELIRNILDKFTFVNSLIFDPFMGTGTTAVACMQKNRRYIGCDINKNYVDISKKRLAQTTLKHYNEQEKLIL